jgi:hypothetical protein
MKDRLSLMFSALLYSIGMTLFHMFGLAVFTSNEPGEFERGSGWNFSSLSCLCIRCVNTTGDLYRDNFNGWLVANMHCCQFGGLVNRINSSTKKILGGKSPPIAEI